MKSSASEKQTLRNKCRIGYLTGSLICLVMHSKHFLLSSSECPELKLLDMGVQNLNIDDCSEDPSLFSADDGYGLIQKQAKGVRGILSPHHAYIDTCASYSSTPYKELLSNLKKQARGLIGHSNAGSCKMDSSGSLGDLEQVWINKGGVATIIPQESLSGFVP